MLDKRANTTKIVGKANSYLVLDSIKNNEAITIDGIIKQTGLSRPTVLKTIKQYLESNLIKKAGYAENEVGRSPVLYSLNGETYFAIGVDIDGPPIYLAVSDIMGKIVYSAKYEVDIDASIHKIIETIVNGVKIALEKLNLESKNIIGMGIGLPASVDLKKKCAVTLSRLEALIEQPIGEMIEQELGIPVLVRNDAQLIGIAESRKLNNAQDILCIVQRTGIGLAIIVDGHIYGGTTGNAGFIGHLTIDENGRPCSCGGKGCLEAMSSKRAIKEIYYEKTGRKLRYREILQAASEKEPVAVETCKNAGRYFGIGIANIIKILDVKTIVISDIRCDEKHIFFKSISKSVKEHLDPFFNKRVKMCVGKLEEGEMGLGGCYYVIDEFFASPKLILKT